MFGTVELSFSIDTRHQYGFGGAPLLLALEAVPHATRDKRRYSRDQTTQTRHDSGRTGVSFGRSMLRRPKGINIKFSCKARTTTTISREVTSEKG